MVIRMGRSRSRPACSTAASRSETRRSWLMRSTSTMPLFTTMPASMIAPITTITLTGVPVRARPYTAPVRASGTVNMMIRGCRKDSNWAAITR
ncbi:MAG: hypothetical protein IPH09_17295 [bacterium]|nr:hypothetical protein [bacterium]